MSRGDSVSGSQRDLAGTALRVARVLAFLVPLVACAIASASAASIHQLSVTDTSGRYIIDLRVELDVPARSAYAVFANLRNLRALNSDVRRAKVVGHGPQGSVDLYSVIRACVLWYCRSLRETQRMTFLRSVDGGEVSARILPRGGDFRAGRAHWRFRGMDGRTLLEMTAEIEPAFRVPPLIGPWLVRRWLRRQVARTAANLEKLTRLRISAGAPDASKAP